MKQITVFLAALAAVLCLNSCLDGGNNEIHQTYFYPTRPSGIEMFADQVVDSTYICSYDSWSASFYVNSGDSWLTITPASAEVPAGSGLATLVTLKATPNTTGLSRYGTIRLNVNANEIGTLAMPVYQYGWLNITVPTPKFTSTDLDTAKPTFQDEFTKNAGSAYLTFEVYSDATIVSDADWLVVPADVAHVKAGSHGLILTVLGNNTGAKREAHVTLTSNGVSNVITYVQNP